MGMGVKVVVSLLTVCIWGCVLALSDADAKLPAPFKCLRGSFLCKNGRECVLHDHVCDGEGDCADGSDEADCPTQCTPKQFQCTHGRKCIDKKEVCDGQSHCQDGSDEKHCRNTGDGCAISCDDATLCLPASFQCDGEKDCQDGTDERGCEGECSSEQFRCASGQCVSSGTRCDGHADCYDHSDEKGCTTTTSSCPSRQHCLDNDQCLMPNWVCDGEDDCKGGVDEKDCQVVQVKCGEFQWPCASQTQCLPVSWRCDGEEDCSDSSDEAGCSRAMCPSHQFLCGSGECVDLALVCNDRADCTDGSDEGGACKAEACSSPDRPQCVHSCYNTPQGARCGCNLGFQLQLDQVTCDDSNECEVSKHVCSHACTNTPGSYLCSCHTGYQLGADAHSCEIIGEPYLLISIQNELLLLGLQSNSLDAIPTPSKNAIMWVDYDWQEQKIFWVNVGAESIRWSSLNKKDKGTAVKDITCDSLAVDWAGRNLYWIDGERSQIQAAILDPTGVTWMSAVIVDEDLEQPRFLALVPQSGIMFWSEIGSKPRIERSGMDGSDRRTIIQDALSWPGSLAVDFLGGRIYWTDEKRQCIGSSTVEGQDVKHLQLTETPRPFSVAVFEDMVYWSDSERRTVQAAHKRTGKNRQTLVKQAAQPLGLKVIHELLQENRPNPCLQSHCSHMCLLAPGPRGVCRCPAELQLAHDGLTCSTAEDSAFVLVLASTSVTQLYLQNLDTEVDLKRWPRHHVLALPDTNEATLLDFVKQDQMLYVADAGQTTVERFQLKDGALQPVGSVVQLQEGDAVIALAVDWVTRSVYWSSRSQPRLHVTSSDGAHTAILLDDLGTPGSIALHPPAGQLCFTDLGPPDKQVPAQVECAFMNGQGRTIVWDKASKPSSLIISPDGTTLYWADTGAGVIGSTNMNGSGYKEFKTSHGLLDALAYADDIFIWVTVANMTKFWLHDGKQRKLWFEVETDVVSLKACGWKSQEGANKCSSRNGGCSHLCLPYPGGRTCWCAGDYRSDIDTDCNEQLRPQAPVPTLSRHDLTHATPLDNSLLRELDAEPCDQKLCNGHGTCVATPDGGLACECHVGFVGPFCQDQRGLSIQTMLPYVGGALVAAVVVIAAILLVMRRRRLSSRREHVMNEISHTELTTRMEPSTQASPDDTQDAEDPESPAD